MNFTGKITHVSEIARGTSQNGKEWASIDFVITNEQDRYPSSICLRIFGEERINELAPKVGEYVTADFDIDAHEYNGRWYNQLTAWRITRPSQPTTPPQQTYPPQQPAQAPTPHQPAPQPPQDDLPF